MSMASRKCVGRGGPKGNGHNGQRGESNEVEKLGGHYGWRLRSGGREKSVRARREGEQRDVDERRKGVVANARSQRRKRSSRTPLT